MKAETIEISVETKGLEEAKEKVQELADAYNGFPSQVTIKGCHDCVFNIYSSQTRYIEIGDTDEDKA